MSRAVQIGEATGNKKSMRVLRQALVADLRELEQLLEGEKRMLDRRSDWAGRLNECSIGRSFREYPGHKQLAVGAKHPAQFSRLACFKGCAI